MLMWSAMNEIDASALAFLETLNRDLALGGIRPHLSEVRGPVGDGPARSDLLEHFAAGAFQFSRRPLLAGEEFGLGGGRFGRGFDPSEITRPRSPVRDHRRPRRGVLPGRAPHAVCAPALSGRGAGLRLAFLGRADGFVELANPLTGGIATEDNGGQPRLLGGITIAF